MVDLRALPAGLALGVTLAASAAAGPDAADAVLNRYVAAAGGAEAIGRVRSRVTEATMRLAPGVSGRLETLQVAPDLVVQQGRASGWGWSGSFGLGFDGRRGWRFEPDKPPRRVDGLELQQLILRTRLDRDAHLDTLYPSRKLLPDAAIAGRAQHVVQLETRFGTRETWWLDAESGLLTRTAVDEVHAGSTDPVAVVITFSDYRVVAGLRLPFRREVQEGSRRYVVVVTSITDNVATHLPVAPKDVD